MSVFVTTMYRYGDREKHSYVLGVWSSSEVAMQAGQTESLWRGGKYEPEVTEWKVDANEFDDIGEQRLTQLAPDSPYVCLHCGAHISSDHLPWCKSLSQNGGR